MADNMTHNVERNNGPYIALGVIVLALILGLFLWMPRNDNLNDIAPTAGDSTVQNSATGDQTTNP